MTQSDLIVYRCIVIINAKQQVAHYYSLYYGEHYFLAVFK